MIRNLASLRQMLGWKQACRWIWCSRIRRKDVIRLEVPWPARHPDGISRAVWARPGSSDLQVFRQIFLEREYAPFDSLGGVHSILDLGANVGYSAVYFLNQFPRAKLLAVEPDVANYGVLQRNLAPFGSRAASVRGGVWNACGGLRLSEVPFRGGGSWSFQVRPAAEGEPGCFPGYDMLSLLDQAGFERISILKVDIEGAEAVVFDDSSSTWLGRVDHIAIELHDDSSFGMVSPVFWKAVAGQGFKFSRSGELVLCSRQ